MWTIHLLKNTVEVTDEIAQEMVDIQLKKDKSGAVYSERWEEPREVVYKGKLIFNGDEYEHMDFLWDNRFVKILKKHKVEGEVCFADLEGSSEPRFWGYRFDGKGKMIKLKGDVVFEEA